MPSYYCWTKHGERGVMMEDNEEEEEDDDGYPNFPEYDDTAEGNEDNEVENQEAPDEPADDDLGRAIADARRECETEKERSDEMTLVMLRASAKKRVPAKRKFIMMPVLIQGPKQPGNDIDVYLKPLVEELLQLWSLAGVRVWDEHKQEEFDLRAMLFVTINDWPALGNISGQSNKGYNACTHCLHELEGDYLEKGQKVVYLGHRRFLRTTHPVRKKGKHYNGEADHRRKPPHRDGVDIFGMVKDLDVIFGKGPGGRSVPNDDAGHAPMWKKKSIFWELEYWKVLEVRSSIDVMHVTKNLCVNLLGFLGVYGKTKDTPEAQEDQQRWKDPKKLHERVKGRHLSSYALTKAEKEIFFECLSSIKVPSGFSSNIKGIINMEKKTFQNLKPEGSISKGYGAEEVIEFCVDFIPDLKPIGVPESRHEGRLSGKGTLGRKSMICNIIIDNFYARLSFQDKTLLDATCSGSFTRNKEEFKRDLLDRIEENAEGWENDKGKESGYADKPPFKPLPPKEGNEEKEKKKKRTKKKKKKENKKKEVTAYPRVNEITLGNRKYVAPNDYCDNESEYDDLPMPFTYISDHDLNEHTTFDITNLWETNSENDDNNCHSVSAIHASSHNDIESSKLGEEVFENPFATDHYVFDTSPSNNNDGMDTDKPTVKDNYSISYDDTVPPTFDDYYKECYDIERLRGRRHIAKLSIGDEVCPGTLPGGELPRSHLHPRLTAIFTAIAVSMMRRSNSPRG
ncbi:hypothetical protein QYE76_027903 [Lolium multiflorum]|uniref:DUF4218 domain-containing protein n=1 Tax=Lolium multiflorum TaxID=4521 RepID=A0AAD8QJY7_LOLMU|nr:hypothetical protein QYE76_027903 [Lolium multiflorum]